MKKTNRFAKGSGLFTCTCCGKQTRSTGRGDNENVRMCADCYDMEGDRNAVSDGAMTEEQFVRAWGRPSGINKK